MTWADILEQLKSLPDSDPWECLKQICDGLDRANIDCTIKEPPASKEDKGED